MAKEAFVEKLKTAETVEQAIALFADEGVAVTAEEFATYLESSQIGDLSEEDLDDVSGGCAICIGFRIAKAIVKYVNRSSGGGHRF